MNFTEEQKEMLKEFVKALWSAYDSGDDVAFEASIEQLEKMLK